MISPELLRRYPFFGSLDDAHLKAIAMLSDEISYSTGETLFTEGKPADRLYLLLEGGIDLRYIVINPTSPDSRKDFFVGEVNPGEPFGISALIEPYCYTTSALANTVSRVLKIDATGLRQLCGQNASVERVLMRHLAKAAVSRLHDTRVQLIAALS